MVVDFIAFKNLGEKISPEEHAKVIKVEQKRSIQPVNLVLNRVRKLSHG